MSGRVLVTGGTGFVGGSILDRLVANGRSVRALARSADAEAELHRRGAEPVRGDVLDRESLIRATDACEIVYHAAGLNDFCLADPGPLFRVNVSGSVNLVEAAALTGVRRIVYTSSAATIGEAKGSVGSEDSPHRGWFLSNYERSKYEAEQAVLGTGLEVEVLSLNPSSVQGPGRTGGSAKLILGLLNGDLRVLVESRFSFVDVADCVEGHLRAEVDGRPGRRYILSGATVSTAEALQLLEELTGIDLDVYEIPPAAARLGGWAFGTTARLLGKDAPFCGEMVRTLLHGHSYDGSRATRELGLVYTPIEQTLRRSVAWYAEHGHLRRKVA